MTKPNALIHPPVEKGDTLIGPDGLTKRELFAVMAMQGILSNSDEAMRAPEFKMCAWATSIADALIKALNETKPFRPKEKTVYLNIYQDDKIGLCASVHHDKDDAIKMSGVPKFTKQLAIATPITVVI